MRDEGSFFSSDRDSPDGYRSLAAEVLESLASRRSRGASPVRPTLLNTMIAAVKSPIGQSTAALCLEFRRSRVPMTDLVDAYIPEVARHLGRAWEQDRVSFAEVTVGLSRLHTLLHEVQADWVADSVDRTRMSATLLIVPPQEQHTLGAMIFASQLRRKGVSVCIRIAPGVNELNSLLADGRFDAAMVTLGSNDRLETCAKLVKTLKTMTKGLLPVSVGGPVVDGCRDVLLDAGVDVVSNDVSTVVQQFKL